MSKPINELFAARRSNHFRYEEEDHIQPLDSAVLAGWFCCGVVVVAWVSLLGWILNWSWNHSETVLAWVGM